MSILDNAYWDIINLKRWGELEASKGNRLKANKIFKVAERWYIKRFGFDCWYNDIFGGGQGRVCAWSVGKKHK